MEKITGSFLPENFTPEDVQKGYSNILDFSKQNDYPVELKSSLEAMMIAEERVLSGNKTNNSTYIYTNAKF